MKPVVAEEGVPATPYAFAPQATIDPSAFSAAKAPWVEERAV